MGRVRLKLGTGKTEAGLSGLAYLLDVDDRFSTFLGRLRRHWVSELYFSPDMLALASSSLLDGKELATRIIQLADANHFRRNAFHVLV